MLKKTITSFALLFSLATCIFLTSTTTASPGIDVQAEKMIVSQDKRDTTFLGDVIMVIPSTDPFEISTIENHTSKGYQLKITTDGSSFLISDARITRVETGLEVRAAEVQASNATE